MKANELRIGNYVNEINVGLISVELSDIEDILYGDINYNPIQLTEKWLLDFGFENENYGWNVKEFGLFDYNYKNGKSLRLALNASPAPVFIIKYVHQLQNLYFALTGEELIYKK